MSSVFSNRSGMIYVMSLAIMIISMGLGLAYLNVARTEAVSNRHETDALRTFYLAEAAAEYSLAELLYGVGADDHDGNVLLSLPDLSEINATYNPTSKTIDAYGQSGSVSKHIQAKVNDSGFIKAVTFENEFSFFGSPGSINGNFEITNNVDDAELATALGPSIVSGKVNRVPAFKAPTPVFTKYQSDAQAGSTYFNTPQEWDKNTVFTDPAAIHYIDSDLYIAGPGPIHIKGTVVVRGTIYLGKKKDLTTAPIMNSSLTFTPAAHKPAVIVGKTISNTEGKMLASPSSVLMGTNIIFDGMVYTEDRISIQSYKTIKINGALVNRSPSSLSTLIQGGNNLTITYDPDIDPGLGYFTGTDVGKVALVSWKGHQE